MPVPFVPLADPAIREPRHRVAIIGAGPTGLALAIDLALHGLRCVVF